MVVLTEELVLAKTRSDSLAAVRNLNLWGSDLSDVAILEKMPNVEVLSLSVNKIRSLRAFRNCRWLTELYLRKNDVTDIMEVTHLQVVIACLPAITPASTQESESARVQKHTSHYIHTDARAHTHTHVRALKCALPPSGSLHPSLSPLRASHACKFAGPSQPKDSVAVRQPMCWIVGERLQEEDDRDVTDGNEARQHRRYCQGASRRTRRIRSSLAHAHAQPHRLRKFVPSGDQPRRLHASIAHPSDTFAFHSLLPVHECPCCLRCQRVPGDIRARCIAGECRPQGRCKRPRCKLCHERGQSARSKQCAVCRAGSGERT